MRFFHFFPAFLARPTPIVIPEFEHCLAKVVHYIGAIEVNILHQSSAILTVENYVLLFSGRAAALYNNASCVRRALRRVRHIRRDEKSFALTDNVIHDPIVFADPDLNIAFELIKVPLPNQPGENRSARWAL